MNAYCIHYRLTKSNCTNLHLIQAASFIGKKKLNKRQIKDIKPKGNLKTTEDYIAPCTCIKGSV